MRKTKRSRIITEDEYQSILETLEGCRDNPPNLKQSNYRTGYFDAMLFSIYLIKSRMDPDYAKEMDRKRGPLMTPEELASEKK